MPLSLAAAMVYAMTGWPPSGLIFLFLTRFEPARAGIKPTMLGVRSRGMGLPLVGEECTTRGDRSQEPEDRRGQGIVCRTYPPVPKVPKRQKSPAPSRWSGGPGSGRCLPAAGVRARL